MSDPRATDFDERSDECIRNVRADVPGAWEALVRRYEQLVLSVPRELGLSDADCEEVFQATWLSLYRQAHSIRHTRSLIAWICTTATRHAWRIQQRARRDEPLSAERALSLADARSPEPMSDLIALERRQIVQEALSELSPRCRQLIASLYSGREAASYSTVAEELGMPIGSVGPTRLRCLAELVRILERRGLP
jgi:RNA polymerase sigma factor (sigma-70 family)